MGFISIIGNEQLCTKCSKWKPLNEYYKIKRSGKHFKICKLCSSKKAKKNRRKFRIVNAEIGYIYIISNPAWNNFIKVGRTSNLERRLASFQTGSPLRDYSYLFTIQSNNVCLAETLIKDSFDVFNFEWIELNADTTLRSIIKKIKSVLGDVHMDGDIA